MTFFPPYYLVPLLQTTTPQKQISQYCKIPLNIFCNIIIPLDYPQKPTHLSAPNPHICQCLSTAHRYPTALFSNPNYFNNSSIFDASFNRQVLSSTYNNEIPVSSLSLSPAHSFSLLSTHSHSLSQHTANIQPHVMYQYNLPQTTAKFRYLLRMPSALT